MFELWFLKYSVLYESHNSGGEVARGIHLEISNCHRQQLVICAEWASHV